MQLRFKYIRDWITSVLEPSSKDEVVLFEYQSLYLEKITMLNFEFLSVLFLLVENLFEVSKVESSTSNCITGTLYL